MRTLRVHDVLKDKILVSRETARQLEDALHAAMAGAVTGPEGDGNAPVVIDFDGVEGVAPSFLDELISIFESVVRSNPDDCGKALQVANPPTRLSLKFEAVARGHAMSIRLLADGSWLLTYG